MSRTELSLSDEWETPKQMFEWLCRKYNFSPSLDVCATKENKKCVLYCGVNGLYDDGLQATRWEKKNWMNPPHSQTEKWVKKACEQFQLFNYETMAMIPANSMCTSYAEACIEPHAEWHMIFERPRFNQDGKPSKDPSRNSYFVVIWRKK